MSVVLSVHASSDKGVFVKNIYLCIERLPS